MSFRQTGSRRPAAEQRYIAAMFAVFAALPPERRTEVRAIIARFAQTPAEGRALFDVLVQGKTIPAAAALTGVAPGRLSKLRTAFYDAMPL